MDVAMRHAAADAHSRGGRSGRAAVTGLRSFDQFRDFEQRGNEFKRIFAILAEEARLRGAA